MVYVLDLDGQPLMPTDRHGNKVNKGSLSYKKIRFLEPKQSYLCERKRMDTRGRD